MNDTDKRLNVLPALAAAAALLGVAALVAAIVAIGKTNDNSRQASARWEAATPWLT